MESHHHVLVTGAAGYIGKHVVLQLLEAGHVVTASMLSSSREVELQNALYSHIQGSHGAKSEALSRLSVVGLDLTCDEGWEDALKNGIDVLIHLASPVPIEEPTCEEDVTRPAIDGALRALRAAYTAGVTRVIVTSSVAAIVNCDLPDNRSEYNESDWTDCTKSGISAYVKSKTLAEKAVWDWCEQNAPEMDVTTILPSFVLGAPLDRHYGSSVRKVQQLLQGKTSQAKLPNYGYSCVDVRDVALMHLRAMERPEQSIGQRFIGSARCFLWVPEMARILHDTYPDKDIPYEKASNEAIQKKAIENPSYRYVVLNLDKRRVLSNEKSCHILGIQYRDPRESLLETAEYLLADTENSDLAMMQ